MKEQTKQKKESELEERMTVLEREKKELGMEFMTLKTNFINLNELKDAVQEEQVNVHCVNLQNENKFHNDRTDNLEISSHQDGGEREERRPCQGARRAGVPNCS